MILRAMTRFGTILVMTSAAVLLAQSPASAQTAKFRVTDAKLMPGGKTAQITIFWEYSTGSNGSGYTADSGKGVKFFVHDSLPSYGKAQLGTPVAQTIDMQNGNGMATLTVPLPKGAKPGANLVLTGLWPNNHQWGVDAQRPGGEFQLPTAKAAGGTVAFNVNRASADDLSQIPGVGKALAQRIVTFRDQLPSKRFRSVDQLTQVKGISASSLGKIGSFLTTKAPPRPKAPLSVNLNTATLAQLQALPGVGPKLVKALVKKRDEMQKDTSKYNRKFVAAHQLTQVPGFTQDLVTKLTPIVKFAGRTTGVPTPKATPNSGLWRPRPATSFGLGARLRLGARANLGWTRR